MQYTVISFLILLISQSFVSVAQNISVAQNDKYVDSLYTELSLLEKNKDKAEILYALSWHYAFTDTIKALEFLNSATKFVDLKRPFEEGRYLFSYAGIYYNHNKERSQELYMKAESLFKEIDTPESYDFRSTLWSNYATLEQIAGNENAYLDIKLNRCIPYAEKSGNIGKLSSYYTDLGLVFFNMQEYEKSNEYCLLSIEQLNNNNIEDWNLLWAYLNLINTLIHQGKEKEAANYLEKAEALLQPVYENEGKYTSFPFFYYLTSLYFELIGNIDSAIQNAQTGILYAEQFNLGYHRFRLIYYLAHFYEINGENNKAMEIIASIKESGGYKNIIENQAVVLNKESELQAKTGDHEGAYQTMRKLMAINDSVYKINTKVQLAELEAKFSASEKERIILDLEKRNQSERIIIAGSTTTIFLIFIFVLYAFNQRKKRAQQNKVSTALLEGQEQERSRVARELHDGVGSKLTAIKLNVENIPNAAKDPYLEKIAFQISEVAADVRNLSHNLMPPSLIKYGLETAIRDYIKNIETCGTSIEYYANNMNALQNKNKQLYVYRIMLELLNNAVTHSKANNIFLQSTINNNLLLIDIEDDGIGFDPQKVKWNMGLHNIETRVKYLNGKINIDSKTVKGTTINIECLV